jgi:NhaP-type Na+/H+ or K+/H+ antiporter
VLSAFCVVLFTLIVQGATLRPLIRRLRLAEDHTVEHEVLVARRETSRTALRELDGQAAEAPRAAVDILRSEYQARQRSAEAPLDRAAPADGGPIAGLQRRLIAAQRQTLMDLRARGVIGDDAFHAAEEEVDLLELTADPRLRPEAMIEELTDGAGERAAPK